jgi:hypothetical protein
LNRAIKLHHDDVPLPNVSDGRHINSAINGRPDTEAQR